MLPPLMVLAIAAIGSVLPSPVASLMPIEDAGGPALLDPSQLMRATWQGGAVPFDAPSSVVQQLAAAALGMAGADRLALVSDTVDSLTLRHVRFHMVVPFTGGVATVEGGDFILHINNQNQVYAVTGTAVTGADTVPLPPSFSSASAQAKAASAASAKAGIHVPPGRIGQQDLKIVPSSQGLVVVWCSNTDLTDAPSPAVLLVCIGAHGPGDVKESRNVLHTAAVAGTGRGFFFPSMSLTSNTIAGSMPFELRDPGSGSHYTIDMKDKRVQTSSTPMTDSDNVWGDTTLSSRQSVAADAHYGAQVTWDYYKSVHSRTGIANNGVGSYSRVHYDRRYNNAFWSDSCFCMTYGDGDGVNFNPFDAIDVVGHEMTHGVTSRTANLAYSGESGGLNEAMSDIFGTMVEFWAYSGTSNYQYATSYDAPDYKIGERLYKSAGRAIRYMYKPSTDGASKDCWSSTLGSLDVHYSSGPANHFFYLLAEGSAAGADPWNFTGSPTCNSATVTGIGRDKAARILYRALTVYMTSSTDYSGARVASLNAAQDLFGAASPEYAAVGNAWAAVSVV